MDVHLRELLHLRRLHVSSARWCMCTGSLVCLFGLFLSNDGRVVLFDLGQTHALTVRVDVVIQSSTQQTHTRTHVSGVERRIHRVRSTKWSDTHRSLHDRDTLEGRVD
jgi:hypothetical protein